MRTITGTIIIKSAHAELTPKLLLELEHKLNDAVASEMYNLFGVGIRVHIPEELRAR